MLAITDEQCIAKTHYIYKVTNTITGEFYIGKRSTEGEPEYDPYMGSGRWIKDNESVYGKYLLDAPKGMFKKDVVEICGSLNEVFAREYTIISRYKDIDPLCRNIADGGTCFPNLIREEDPDPTLYDLMDIETGYVIKATMHHMKHNLKMSNYKYLIQGFVKSSNGYCLLKNRDEFFLDLYNLDTCLSGSYPKRNLHITLGITKQAASVLCQGYSAGSWCHESQKEYIHLLRPEFARRFYVNVGKGIAFYGTYRELYNRYGLCRNGTKKMSDGKATYVDFRINKQGVHEYWQLMADNQITKLSLKIHHKQHGDMLCDCVTLSKVYGVRCDKALALWKREITTYNGWSLPSINEATIFQLT